MRIGQARPLHQVLDARDRGQWSAWRRVCLRWTTPLAEHRRADALPVGAGLPGHPVRCPTDAGVLEEKADQGQVQHDRHRPQCSFLAGELADDALGIGDRRGRRPLVEAQRARPEVDHQQKPEDERHETPASGTRDHRGQRVPDADQRDAENEAQRERREIEELSRRSDDVHRGKDPVQRAEKRE